jgi:hypothetical protein
MTPLPSPGCNPTRPLQITNQIADFSWHGDVITRPSTEIKLQKFSLWLASCLPVAVTIGVHVTLICKQVCRQVFQMSYPTSHHPLLQLEYVWGYWINYNTDGIGCRRIMNCQLSWNISSLFYPKSYIEKLGKEKHKTISTFQRRQ